MQNKRKKETRKRIELRIKIYDYIAGHIAECEIPPTKEKICERLGISPKTLFELFEIKKLNKITQ